MGIFLIILGIIVLLAVMVAGIYNRYIRLKNLNKEGWSGVEVHLQKRWDLIPNLVNTVKGYATHEKETLSQVIAARSGYNNATTTEEKVQAANMLTNTLKTLFAVSETYPDLKANAGFLSLQSELSVLEQDIASSRRYFNATIREYNTALEKFPNNLVAGIFGFKNQKEYFEITDEEEKKTPKVQF